MRLPKSLNGVGRRLPASCLSGAKLISCSLWQIAAVLLLVLSGVTSWGTSIAAWDFSPIVATDNWGASPYAATADPSVTVVGLTRNWTYGTGTPAAAAWGGNNFSSTATSRDLALAANNFVTFTITPKAGCLLSFTDISAYNIRRSASGPSTGLWQYKVGAGAFKDIGTSITWGSVTTSAGNSENAITLSGIADLQNLAAGTTVTFRIVMWGATSTGGTWYLNDPTKAATADLTVNGTVTTLSTHTVTYSGNGSDGGTAPTDGGSPYVSGSTVTVKAAGAMTRTGYIFNGWNTVANGSGTAYAPNDTFSITANTTLYAQWSAAQTDPSAQGSANPASVVPGGTATLTVNVTPGANPSSTGLSATADLSSIGGSSAQAFFTSGGNLFTYQCTVASGTPAGSKTLPIAVSDGQGRMATGSITLYVSDLAITAQPVDQTAEPGRGATFTVAATGAGISYQWQRGGTNLTDGPYVSGSTSARLNLYSVADSDATNGNYRAVIMQGAASLPSREATLILAKVTPGTFSIFHVNDTHARITPHYWVIPKKGATDGEFELVGGAACMAAEVMALRTNTQSSLFLDAGDISEGNPIGDMTGNGAMVQFYNLLDSKLKAATGRGIDASVVGNHDVRDISYINNLRSATYPVISIRADASKSYSLGKICLVLLTKVYK